MIHIKTAIFWLFVRNNPIKQKIITNFKDLIFQHITFFHQPKSKNSKICLKIYNTVLRRVRYSHFKCTCFQDFDLDILSVQIVFKSITCLVQKQEKRARAKSGKRGYHSEGKKGRERVQRGICWMIKTKVECMNELVLFSSGLPLLTTDGSKILGLFSWKTYDRSISKKWQMSVQSKTPVFFRHHQNSKMIQVCEVYRAAERYILLKNVTNEKLYF